jgi:hypothetical protein
MDHKKRIAVIAVHGVGHQQPHTSAERAADLLRNQCKGYDWVGQSTVRIPVSPIITDTEYDKKDRARYVSQTLKAAIQGEFDASDEREAKDQRPLDVYNMREWLDGYKPRGADLTYDTTCIQLQKADGIECHVFEMFWADLSRHQQKAIGTAIDFYQLLFFLTNLGGRAIHYARAKYARNNRWWCGFDWGHWLAQLILVLGIPILNLVLLGLGIAAALSGYSEKFKLPDWSLALFLGAILVCGAAFVFREQKVPARSRPKFFALALVLPLLLALVLPLAPEFKRY